MLKLYKGAGLLLYICTLPLYPLNKGKENLEKQIKIVESINNRKIVTPDNLKIKDSDYIKI